MSPSVAVWSVWVEGGGVFVSSEGSGRPQRCHQRLHRQSLSDFESAAVASKLVRGENWSLHLTF